MSRAGNLNKLVTEVIRRELLTDDLVTVIITVLCDVWTIGQESKFQKYLRIPPAQLCSKQ